MDEKTQTDHFSNDLAALVDRYRREYDMSYAAVIGTLHLQIFILCDEGCDDELET